MIDSARSDSGTIRGSGSAARQSSLPVGSNLGCYARHLPEAPRARANAGSSRERCASLNLKLTQAHTHVPRSRARTRAAGVPGQLAARGPRARGLGCDVQSLLLATYWCGCVCVFVCLLRRSNQGTGRVTNDSSTPAGTAKRRSSNQGGDDRVIRRPFHFPADSNLGKQFKCNIRVPGRQT